MTETEHALGAAALVPVGRADAPSSRYDANEPQQQIEADIARTRDRVGSTLDALERKLSPRRLIAEGTDSLLDAVGRDPDKIWTQLRANAIPLGLIAAGLAWLVFARQEPRSGTRNDASDNRTKTAGTPLPLAAPHRSCTTTARHRPTRPLASASRPAKPSKRSSRSIRPRRRAPAHAGMRQPRCRGKGAILVPRQWPASRRW